MYKTYISIILFFFMFMVPVVSGQYGEMFNHSDSGITVSIPLQNTYYVIDQLEKGELGNVTFTNNMLRIESEGIYQTNWHLSFAGGVSDEYQLSIFVNDIIRPRCEQHRKMGTGGDIGSVSGHCLLNLTKEDNMTLKIRDLNSPDDIVYDSANININKIFNTFSASAVVTNLRPDLTLASDAYKPIFIIQFIIFICLLLIKLYNVMMGGKWYDGKIVFMTWITGLLMYGIGMVTQLIYFDNLLITQLFWFEGMLFMLMTLLSILELFLFWKDNLFKKKRGRAQT